MTRSEALKLRSEFTDKLSTQCRTISIGVLAGIWGVFFSDKRPFHIEKLKWHLVAIGAGAVLVLFLDFLQYVAGIKSVSRVLAKMDAPAMKLDSSNSDKSNVEKPCNSASSDGENESKVAFDQGSWPYIASASAFELKLILLTATILYMLAAVGMWLERYGLR